MAKAFDSQITLIYIFHTVAFAVGEAAPSVVETAPVAEKKACEAFLSKVSQDLQSQGVNVNWVCVEGVPAREIINYADTNNFDLIAMATHGKGEVAWVLGSVAEKVVTHATVPVLLFRVMEAKPLYTKEEFLELLARGIP